MGAEELNFHHFNTVDRFIQLKISADLNNTHYNKYSFTNGSFNIIESAEGIPDIKYQDLVWIKSCTTCWTHGNFYITSDPSIFVTFENFSPVETAALNAISKGSLHTINGKSIETEDVELDLSLYKIVTTLPTKDIQTNKIYIIQDSTSKQDKNIFNEFVYIETESGGYWELIGQITSEIDLSGYLKIADADKKYLPKRSNNSACIEVSSTGSMSNFGDNGQAYLAVRPATPKFLLNTPYAGAAFGVKDDGTAAFSHKTYTSYDKDKATYKGAKNTAVLQFAGPTGLRYAKNMGSGNDVTEDMYRYVGIIDSPDEKQKVYSAKQVDELLKTISEKIGALQDRITELEKNI